MGVGHQQVIDGARRKGKLLIGHLVPSLLESAVHQDALAVYLQAVAGAGHTLIRAEKAQLHKETSFISAPAVGTIS